MSKDVFRELVDKDYADNFMTGRVYELTQEEINKLSQPKEVNMSEQITTKKTVEELIDSRGYCPLPLDVIPNNMGINLCSVESIEWTKQADGQLVNLQINFIPANTEFYEWLLQKGYRMRNGKIIKYPSLKEISDSEAEALQNEYQAKVK